VLLKVLSWIIQCLAILLYYSRLMGVSTSFPHVFAGDWSKVWGSRGSWTGTEPGESGLALVKSFPRLLVCPSAFSRSIAIDNPMSPLSTLDPQFDHCEYQTSHAHDPLDDSRSQQGHPVPFDDIVSFHMPAVAS
jgi:hypothetical protein